MPEKREKDKILKPQKPRDKTFGCKDWVEDVVEPMGPRGELLWRSIAATHRLRSDAEDLGGAKKNWSKFSPHVKDWK